MLSKCQKEKQLFIATPVNQDVLFKKDDYLVSCKRAFHRLKLDVMFVEMPGTRSLCQLKKIVWLAVIPAPLNWQINLKLLYQYIVFTWKTACMYFH